MFLHFFAIYVWVVFEGSRFFCLYGEMVYTTEAEMTPWYYMIFIMSKRPSSIATVRPHINPHVLCFSYYFPLIYWWYSDIPININILSLSIMAFSSVGRSGESEGGVERRRRVGRRTGGAGGAGASFAARCWCAINFLTKWVYIYICIVGVWWGFD